MPFLFAYWSKYSLLISNWKMIFFLQVLQLETIVIKICTSTLKIIELVNPLLTSPIDNTTIKFIEVETQNLLLFSVSPLLNLLISFD